MKGFMNNIYDCVDSYAPLLDVEYSLLLGRKGKTTLLNIQFCENDFFHLLGLQYLTDLAELKRDRKIVFNALKSRIIHCHQIESSCFYNVITNRIRYLPSLEFLFDSNDTIFKYNNGLNSFSKIQAEFLMKNTIEDKNIFIFLSSDKSEHRAIM